MDVASRAAGGRVVDLVVDLDGSSLSTIRLVAAAFGADAGWSVDEIDDVKLALSEAFSLLLAGGDHVGRAVVSFDLHDRRIEVTFRAQDGRRPAEADDLTRRIAAAVVDRFEVADDHVTVAKAALELA